MPEVEDRVSMTRAPTESIALSSRNALKKGERLGDLSSQDFPNIAKRSHPIAKRLTIPGFRTLSFVFFVAIPVFISSIYLTFFASNQYVSEFRVAVHAVDPIQTTPFSSLLGLGGMSQSGQNSFAVVQYLKSRQAVDDLDKEISLRSMYSGDSIDWLSRSSSDKGVEIFVRYWQKMIDAYFEQSTGTIIVRVRAFSPTNAFAIASASLQLSEQLVNNMSARTRDDTVAVADAAVEKTFAQLNALHERAQGLRDRYHLLDPKTSGVSTLALVSKVREDLVLSYAELTDKRRTLSEDSPPIVALKSKINGLNAQLSQLNGENTQTSDSKGSTISSVMTEFDKLQEEEVFAEKSYQSELSALQQARLEASRQQVYLSRIVPPGLPEEPDFPRPMSETLVVFTVGLALWIVAMVGLSAVREHL